MSFNEYFDKEFPEYSSNEMQMDALRIIITSPRSSEEASRELKPHTNKQ